MFYPGDIMNPGLILAWLPVAGILIGLLRVRYRRVPWIVAGVVVAAYALYLAAFGAWASRCWSCSGDVTATRGDSFIVSVIILGLTAVVMLAGIALGARLTVVLGRLFGAARDVRDSLRDRQSHHQPPTA